LVYFFDLYFSKLEKFSNSQKQTKVEKRGKQAKNTMLLFGHKNYILHKKIIIAATQNKV